eukprot:jgi/Tetstr1/426779/TSEL_016994.t1
MYMHDRRTPCHRELLLHGDWREAAKLKGQLGLAKEDPASDEHPALLALWEEAHTANADRVYKSIVGLRGLWVKVGQYLSSRVDVVPIPYIKRLVALQDDVPPYPWKEVDLTLREELGASWRDAFVELDETPLSAASVAQVHRAKLRSGEEVVVKVQHRGVAPRMRSDLANLSTLCRIIAWLEPDYDFRKIVDEWKPAVEQELDMRIEARALKEVAANMKAAGVRAIVPAPRDDMLSRRVLVMEFCHGFSVRSLELMDKHGVDREALLHRVCHAWAVQMHVDGFFNADPHPGNILVSTSPEQNGGDPSVPVLLDFGLTKRFEPNMHLAFARMMHACHSMDVDELVAAFKAMDLKMTVDDPLEDLTNMRKVFQAVPREKAQAMRNQMKAEHEAKMASHPNPKKVVESWPAELVFFFRVTGLLRGLASSLEVDYPYLKTMATAALETIKGATPAAERAQGLLYAAPGRPATELQSKLEAAVTRLAAKLPLVGLQVAVYERGTLLANVAAGTLGVADPRPVTPDTLFNVFSVTKGVAAAAVLMLAQQGKVELDAKVADYWPEFGGAGKEACTVRQLLCHQAGLADAMPEVATLRDFSDYDKMVAFVGGAAPAHPPGAETHYHYLTFGWLLGGLARGAVGQELPQIVQESIAKPLGLEGSMYIGIPKDMPASRLAVLNNGYAEEFAAAAKGGLANGLLGSQGEQQRGAIMHSQSSLSLPASAGSPPPPPLTTTTPSSPAPAGEAPAGGNGGAAAVWARFRGKEHLLNPTTFNMRQVREAALPAANGHMSAAALARFYAGLVSAVDGAPRLLTPETVAACLRCADELQGGGGGGERDVMLAQSGARFGLGFQVHAVESAAGEALHSMGHAGVGGSLGFAIPEKEIAVGITVNNLTSSRAVTNALTALICRELGVQPPAAMVGPPEALRALLS